MTTKKDFEIAIIGGGIAGATLAIALLNQGVPVRIYEQGHGFSEIGAGVAFSPNSLRAMDVCHSSLRAGFERVATRNGWESKRGVFFDFLDGTPAPDGTDGGGGGGDRTDILFSLVNGPGQNAVHRAHFMDEIAALVPEGVAHFRKHLDTVVEDPLTGKMKMTFHDGTTAEADAVIGCDGIKSRVRAMVVGEDHPSAQPSYTHYYAYRGVVPMKKAVEYLGEERAKNATWWMGPNGHMLAYAVSGGEIYNMFAPIYDPNDWPSKDKLTLPATIEDALKDFEQFAPAVKKNFEMVEGKFDRWALFDTGDNPVPTFYKGRICLAGDAAHATTPHHGAGAGFCIEDSAVLASILADDQVKTSADLECAFAAFNACRKERGQWLVQSSRRQTALSDWRAEDVGKDFKKIQAEMTERFQKIWDYDIKGAIEEAKKDLGRRLAVKA